MLTSDCPFWNSDNPHENSPSSSSSSYVYTRPADAFHSSLTSTSSSSSSTNPPPSSIDADAHSAFPFTTSTAAGGGGARRRQRQSLTTSEAATFADLLSQLLPRTPSSSPRPSSRTEPSSPLMDLLSSRSSSTPPSEGTGPTSGLDSIRAALARKTERRISAWERRTRAATSRDSSDGTPGKPLSLDEMDRLDRSRQDLFESCRSVNDVFRWAEKHVWGHGAEGPESHLYGHLVMLVFRDLKETYSNPHAALDVFDRVSTLSPLSFVRGCGAGLFNEVLNVQWELSEGDVELVARTLGRMRASGVMFDHRTREVVERIGEAVRIDGERAEARVRTGKIEGGGELTQAEKVNLVDEIMDEEAYLVEHRARLFSAKQIEAWRRMEMIVEDNLREVERSRRAIEEEKWASRERAKQRWEDGERQTAEKDSPSLVKGGGGWGEDFWKGEIVGGAGTEGRRTASSSRSTDGFGHKRWS